MNDSSKRAVTLWGLAGGFALLAGVFSANLPDRTAPRPPIPLVDPAFLDTATWRKSYNDHVRSKDDLSDFDCLACHEKNEPPVLRYDANHRLLIPEIHATVVMGHGTHGRNNNCYNCHNETNLATLSPRDGRELAFAESTLLCGSCHGPTLRDWDSGSHGRTNGYWDRALGPAVKKDCVNCHNPHAPEFPGRQPAPGPHSLHSPIDSPGARLNEAR